MYYKSKRLSLITLFLTASIFSFSVILMLPYPQDSIITLGLPVCICVYLLSLVVYLFDPATKSDVLGKQIDPVGVSVLEHLSLVQYVGLKRIIFTIVIQVILAIGFFLYLK